MRSDREVIADAIPIIENQWCKESWHIDRDDAEMQGLPRKAHFCAMGAVQKSLGMKKFGDLNQLANDYNSPQGQAKVAQARSIAGRLAEVIREQYPEFARKYADAFDGDSELVEYFNDDEVCDREAMLAVFEKAAQVDEVVPAVATEIVKAKPAFPDRNKVLTECLTPVV